MAQARQRDLELDHPTPLNPNGEEVSRQWLERQVHRCLADISTFPTGRYLVFAVCQCLIDEYRAPGPVEMSRYREHQELRQPLLDALANPTDLTVLDQLVRVARTRKVI